LARLESQGCISDRDISVCADDKAVSARGKGKSGLRTIDDTFPCRFAPRLIRVNGGRVDLRNCWRSGTCS